MNDLRTATGGGPGKGGEGGEGEERKGILTNLTKAKHPEIGAKLDPIELETEAFGFMYLSLSLC
jgi:hypothetical protein